MVKRNALKICLNTFKALGYCLAGGLVTFLVLGVLFLNNQPDLKVWHTVHLDEEFTKSSPVHSFQDYLALENRLFAQFETLVLDKIDKDDEVLVNRFYRKSLSYPGRWSPNRNRTFELATESPRAGVLLLHGMSDSPYSLHSIADRLHEQGAWVVGLRIPGHGTAPSGLVTVKWEDMAKAVELAMIHLREKVGGKELMIVGYSNGGALAVHYSITALSNANLPLPGKIVLISPEIGITPMASFAIWQERLGRLLRLEKLKWNSVLPEYDPFKYGSFAVNAGNQAYRITETIRRKLDELSGADKLQNFPQTIAFQSVVDATVSASAVVHHLLERLPERGHELVLFGINRRAAMEQLLKSQPTAWTESVSTNSNLTFKINLVTNKDEASLDAVLKTRLPGSIEISEKDLGLAWPEGIYSLAHVALPFNGNDPLYGGDQPGQSPGIQLGRLALRGEKGVLKIPANDLMRLRWNPFYPFMEQKIIEFLGIDE